MTTKLEVLRALEAAGFALFPLKGKVPANKDNWRQTKVGRFAPEDLEEGNYGIVLPARVVVVDIDPRNFPAGDNPAQRLAEAVGAFPDTFRVKTGGGGLHLLYAKPDDVKVVGKLKEFPGIDFKTEGGYIVGPGSVHPDTGKEYAVLAGSPGALAAAPAKLLEMLKRNDGVFKGAGTGEYKEDADTVRRYCEWLEADAPPSIEGEGGDANAFKVAARGRDLALPPELTWNLMLERWNPRCEPPWEEGDLKAKVIHAYKYASGAVGAAHPAADFKDPLPSAPAPPEPGKAAVSKVATAVPVSQKDGDGIEWLLTAQGVVQKNFFNLLNYMQSSESGMSKSFAYNEFTCQVEFVAPAPWHRGAMPASPVFGDDDLKMLKAHLARRFHFERSVSEIEEAVLATSKDRRFHPVREYLESLAWDGRPRLDTWLRDYLGVEDSAYSRAVSRKVLCAAAMRPLAPGCKFDAVLVLEGEQGVGKSSVCSILGGQWFGDFPVDAHNKDTVQMMCGKWIIELAELDILDRTSMAGLRAFVSRPTDKARFAYARVASEYPRQSIFIATVNPGADNSYLKDDTGNRRFWPVTCRPAGGLVDFQKLQDARDQLFAEAVWRVREKGERLDMHTPELKAAAKAVVATRQVEHPWTERVGAWLDSLTPPRGFVTARDVFVEALGGIDKQLDRRTQLGVAQAMRSLGWTPAVRHAGRRPVRGYEAPGGGGELSAPPADVRASAAIDELLGDKEPDIEDLERQHALAGSGLI